MKTKNKKAVFRASAFVHDKDNSLAIEKMLARLQERFEARGCDTLMAQEFVSNLWRSFEDDSMVEIDSERDRIKFIDIAADVLAFAYAAGRADGMYDTVAELFYSSDRDGVDKRKPVFSNPHKTIDAFLDKWRDSIPE